MDLSPSLVDDMFRVRKNTFKVALVINMKLA